MKKRKDFVIVTILNHFHLTSICQIIIIVLNMMENNILNQKKHFGGQKGFEQRVKHDKIKNEYCKNNGISLLRISYYKNVEEELNNFLFI